MNKKVNIDYKRIPHYIFIAAIVIALPVSYTHLTLPTN